MDHGHFRPRADAQNVGPASHVDLLAAIGRVFLDCALGVLLVADRTLHSAGGGGRRRSPYRGGGGRPRAPALFAAGSELLGLVFEADPATVLPDRFSGGRFTSSLSGCPAPLDPPPPPSMPTSSLFPSQLAAWYSITPFGKFLPQSGHWIRRWFCSELPLTPLPPPWRRRVPPACAF